MEGLTKMADTTSRDQLDAFYDRLQTLPSLIRNLGAPGPGSDSLRSRRKHKAWGASPRIMIANTLLSPRSGRKRMSRTLPPVSRARTFLVHDPGACAPGFMPPPASQVEDSNYTLLLFSKDG
jgi:hypothetical protein